LIIPKPPSVARPHMRIPRPPLPLSIRERLTGQRSIVFIGLMVLRLAFTIVQGVESAKDLRYAAIGASIYFMAIFIASPDRRLRAPSIGIMCGLIWSYALVDPDALTLPGLQSWPLFLMMVVLAGLVELAFSHAQEQAHAETARVDQALRKQHTLLAGVCQAVAILLFVVPVAVICLIAARTYGVSSTALPDELKTLVPIAFSLPPVVGMVVYTSFALRRLRTLRLRPTRT